MRLTVRKILFCASFFVNFFGIIYFLRYTKSHESTIDLLKRAWKNGQRHYENIAVDSLKIHDDVRRSSISGEARIHAETLENKNIDKDMKISSHSTYKHRNPETLETTKSKTKQLAELDDEDNTVGTTVKASLSKATTSPAVTNHGVTTVTSPRVNLPKTAASGTETPESKEKNTQGTKATEPAVTIKTTKLAATTKTTVLAATTKATYSAAEADTTVLAATTENLTTKNGVEPPTEAPDHKSTQQCKIPQLDPFHEEVLPWAGHRKSPSCNTTTYSTVVDGVLHLKLDRVQRAGFQYIRRYYDVYGYLSKSQVLVNSSMYTRDAVPSCIQKEEVGRHLSSHQDQGSNDTFFIVSPSPDTKCTEDKMFIIKDENIIHVPTGRCLIPEEMNWKISSYKVVTEKRTWEDAKGNCTKIGGNLITITTPSLNKHLQEELQKKKIDIAWIGFNDNLKEGKWQWVEEPTKCNTTYTQWRKGEPNGKTRENCANMYSNANGHWNDENCKWSLASICGFGSQTCENPRIKLSKTVDECSSSYAKFEVEKNRLKHKESSGCILESENGYLRLGPCNDNSSIFHIPPDIHPSADVDIKVPLTEEAIKVELMHRLHFYEEYHIIVMKSEEEKKKEQEGEGKPIDQTEMNILLIVYDSSSRANIQRQWTNSYKWFENDPDSVIMKGHVINGDATTANMTPLFTGYAVKDLPEARSHKPNWGYVNRWPLILKDFHSKHYKTAYMEDQPMIGTFNYRLSGFKEKPVDKHVSYWFTQNRYRKHNAPDCSNKYILKYIKDFLKTYAAVKKFAWGFVSYLSHDDLDLMHLTDQEMMSFMQFMKETGFRENTTILTFGDHGFRNGKYRGMMQGKLEERLPFLAFSMPSWFKEKHPEKWKNLNGNSEVLTSWFDIYQTLRHLLHMNNYTNNRPIGKSLFTDVTHLNRSCEDCGIPIHYCPCLVSTRVSNNDSVVVSVGEFVVSYMNELISNETKPAELCSKIVLDAVTQADTVTINKDVQSFYWAYDNGTCDRCGIYKNNNFKLKIVNYEVQFRVKNFGGMYEASVDYGGSGNKFKLNGDITRVDRYGDQPKCIQKEYATLRKFCFCKDFKITT